MNPNHANHLPSLGKGRSFLAPEGYAFANLLPGRANYRVVKNGSNASRSEAEALNIPPMSETHRRNRKSQTLLLSATSGVRRFLPYRLSAFFGLS